VSPAAKAPRRIPTVVTFLEMTNRPVMAPPPAPAGRIALLRAEKPPVHFYRYLYDTVGHAHYWVDRKKLDDVALENLLANPKVHLYVLYAEGCPAGMAEYDFRNPAVGQLSYFGLVPDYIGRHLGHYFLFQSVLNAWDEGVETLRVNTCTLDSPRALPLYQRVGFVPYTREDRYIELP
jgi:GNAT superfamily N-acetyltransferase